MSPRTELSFCACKTTRSASKLLVSMGPSPHLWFLHEKQRLYEQNYKSLWVPDQTSLMAFCIQNSDFITRIGSLYGSQPSSVALCLQNCVISIRNTSLYGSQPAPIVLCLQNSVISTRNTSLHGSQTAPLVLWMQNKVISIRIIILYGIQP